MASTRRTATARRIAAALKAVSDTGRPVASASTAASACGLVRRISVMLSRPSASGAGTSKSASPSANATRWTRVRAIR